MHRASSASRRPPAATAAAQVGGHGQVELDAPAVVLERVRTDTVVRLLAEQGRQVELELELGGAARALDVRRGRRRRTSRCG